MKNVIEKIDILSSENVCIKNPDRLTEIINGMVEAGVNKLQIVSDFDRTITKQHENGVPHLSSFAMFSKMPSTVINEKFQSTVNALRKKYYPIEIDPHMPYEEKVKCMEEWWQQSEKAMCGLKVSQKEIEEICMKLKPSLRNGSKEFFQALADEKVPVIVFSAGCGDIVSTVLQQCDVFLSNVKVISNFLKYNGEGEIQGFSDKIIHVLNKNEYAIKNSEFYNVVADRENVIILGDSLGDATMAEGMENLKHVLKIGFLYDHIEQYLPLYMDTFDIVLKDDQTMNVPKAIFDYIKTANSSELKKD